MGEPYEPGAFVGVDSGTRRIVLAHRVIIRPHDVGGVRLVSIRVERDPLPQYGATVYLRQPSAVAAGHALINGAARQPLDDACEPWDRNDKTPLPDAWLDRVREELADDPRATSKGHKATIYACRRLVDEVDRLRRGGGHG